MTIHLATSADLGAVVRRALREPVHLGETPVVTISAGRGDRRDLAHDSQPTCRKFRGRVML